MESIHNVSTEAIVAAIAFLTTAGGGLSVALAKMWQWVDKRIIDCESDRGVLHGKIEDMHGEITVISRTVGQMEGELKQIKVRNDSIDDKKIT